MKPANYAPIYACVYAQLAEISRSHGYALAAHGSLAADFDLICVPWAEVVSDPQSVVDEITSSFAIEQAGTPETKEHGRIAYTISFSFGECRLDLSFMPQTTTPASGAVPVQAIAGIELAAKWVERRASDYDAAHGHTDPDTGTREYPGDGAEYYGELLDIADGIRALLAKGVV